MSESESAYTPRLIGRGTWGWVFRPPLGQSDEEKIGKILKYVNYGLSQEIRLGKLTDSIDPEHGFTVQLESMSYVDGRKIIDACKSRRRYLLAVPFVRYVQLVFPFAGRSLSQVIDGRPSFQEALKIIRSSEHAFIGIKKMIAADLLHADLHVDNITHNGDRLYMIDFGQTVSGNIYSRVSYLHLDRVSQLRFRQSFAPPEVYRHFHPRITRTRLIKRMGATRDPIRNDQMREYFETKRNVDPALFQQRFDSFGLGISLMKVLQNSVAQPVEFKKYRQCECLLMKITHFNPFDRLGLDDIVFHLRGL